MLPTSCYSIFKVQWTITLTGFRPAPSFAGACCFSLTRSQEHQAQANVFTYVQTQFDPAYRRVAKKRTLRCCQRLFIQAFVSLFVFYFSIRPTTLSGDEGIRTPGLRLAKAALSQLSYIPRFSDGPLAGFTHSFTRAHGPFLGNRWAFQGSNLRPRPYQRRALTS